MANSRHRLPSFSRTTVRTPAVAIDKEDSSVVALGRSCRALLVQVEPSFDFPM
jgi:hypothetical protein